MHFYHILGDVLSRVSGCCVMLCAPCYLCHMASLMGEDCWLPLCVQYTLPALRLKLRTEQKIEVFELCSVFWQTQQLRSCQSNRCAGRGVGGEQLELLKEKCIIGLRFGSTCTRIFCDLNKEIYCRVPSSRIVVRHCSAIRAPCVSCDENCG